jgi:chaperonin cofactor prefoldin
LLGCGTIASRAIGLLDARRGKAARRRAAAALRRELCASAAPHPSPDQGTEQVQVTWEDQQNINAFSKLNLRRHELESMIQGLKARHAWQGPRGPSRPEQAGRGMADGLPHSTGGHVALQGLRSAPRGAALRPPFRRARLRCGRRLGPSTRTPHAGAQRSLPRPRPRPRPLPSPSPLPSGAQKELEDLDDASAELLLADDDDGGGDDGGGGGGGVRMLVGAAFLHTPKDEAEAKVEALAEGARSKLGELSDELGGVAGRLEELKAALYARLGRGNINLEE